MKNSKPIIFVNQSSGYLMVDIIHANLDEGSECVLLTGFLNPRKRPLHDKTKVHYLKKYQRESLWRRLLSWSLFSIQVFFFLTIKYRKATIFWVTNPPFTVLLAWLFIKRRFAFLIYDVYPDVLVQAKLLKEKSILVKFWRKANEKVWARSEKLFVIGNAMKALLPHTIQDRVRVVPVWTDTDFLKPIKKDQNPFFKEFGFENKFIVMYSGNLGITHPVEVLVDVANQLKEVEEIQFVIIGDGGKKRVLMSNIEQYGLSNVSVFPWQPTEKLPHTLAAADVGIVTLEEGSSNLSVPSKAFDLMSVGAVILGIGSESSELGRLFDHYNFGQLFLSSEVEGIATFIRNLHEDPDLVTEYSSRSIKASKDFTSKNAMELKIDV